MTVKKTGWADKSIAETTKDNAITIGTSVPVALMNIDEGFDAYDMIGYDLGKVNVEAEPPLIRFDVTEPGSFLVNSRKKLLTDLVRPAGVSDYDWDKPRDEWSWVKNRYWGIQADDTPDAIYRMGSLKLFGTPADGPKQLEFLALEHDNDLEMSLRANHDLLGNEVLMRPMSPLSTAEIKSAISKGKAAGLEDDAATIFDFKGNGGGQQNGQNLLLNLNLNGIAVDKQYFALVDYRSWLAASDWEFTKDYMIGVALKHHNQDPENSNVVKLVSYLSGISGAGLPPKGAYPFRYVFKGGYSKAMSYTID